MKQLRVIRIFLTTLFFVASVAYLCIGVHVHPMAVVSERTQIILSQLAMSLGATIIWIVLTFLFGRIYCSSVCPIGSLQDLILAIEKKFMKHPRVYRYRPPLHAGLWILITYLITLVAGITVVAYIVEPWNMMRNIASIVNPKAIAPSWIASGLGLMTGVITGIATAVILVLLTLLTGRRFCSDICPLGAALGLAGDKVLWHIEIDPDQCIDCGACEDVCKAQCIHMVERRVDDPRCVRCFDCLAVCPNDAIRYQSRRNRRGTPLMRKTTRLT